MLILPGYKIEVPSCVLQSILNYLSYFNIISIRCHYDYNATWLTFLKQNRQKPNHTHRWTYPKKNSWLPVRLLGSKLWPSLQTQAMHEMRAFGAVFTCGRCIGKQPVQEALMLTGRRALKNLSRKTETSSQRVLEDLVAMVLPAFIS